MKSADFYKHRLKWGVLKRFWLPLLVAVPLSGILLVAIQPSLKSWMESFTGQKLDAQYQYRFQRPSQGSTTLALNKEIDFYQQRIRQDPDSGLNRALLAQSYIQMARATGESNWYLLAEQTAQQSLTNLPFDNSGAKLALARVATAKHDFPEAIRLATQVQGNEDALAILVTANLATGEIAKANQAADTLVKQAPSLGSLTLQALVKVALGKDQDAIQSFQRALAVEEAEETGSSVWARTVLGRLYFKRGQVGLARQLYQESLRILPQYPPALLNLAELEIRQGDYAAAERLYSKFFVISQRSPTVYDHVIFRGMARVKDLQGDSSEGRKWRDAAEARLREDLTSFGHRRELARLLLERDRPEDRKEALSLMQAEVSSRQDAETLDTLAGALMRAGRWQEAQQAMQKALRWGIRDPGLFYRASQIEQALGNQEKAIAFSQLAQQTDPTFDAKAQQALGLGVGLLGLN